MGDLLSALTGLSAGVAIGGTACAFFVALGIFSKLALSVHYKTSGRPIAASSAAGGVFGCFVTIFRTSITGGHGITAFFGLFSGIYLGIFIACLAEVANMLPVMKNTGLTKRVISFILLGFVLGKLGGSLVYWLSGVF